MAAPEFYYKDSAGSAWRLAKEAYYKDSGTWRKAKEIWYRDAGTWRKVFAGFVISLANQTAHAQRSLATCAVTADVQNDGTIVWSKTAAATWAVNPTSPKDWITPSGGTPGNNYWVRVTLSSGNAFTIGTMATWLALTSTRTWQLSATSGNLLANISTIEIATDSGGSNIVGSATWDFESDAS